jgi:hypothetical protein
LVYEREPQFDIRPFDIHDEVFYRHSATVPRTTSEPL